MNGKLSPSNIPGIRPDDRMMERNVRAAFEQVVRGDAAPALVLDAVRGLVRHLKKDGEPPERVLVTVKRLCGMPLVPFAGHAADPAAASDGVRSLSEAVIGVAIREYFSRPVLERAGGM